MIESKAGRQKRSFFLLAYLFTHLRPRFSTYLCSPIQRGVRVVEGARLESVYGSKGHRGFESHPLCENPVSNLEMGFLVFGPNDSYAHTPSARRLGHPRPAASQQRALETRLRRFAPLSGRSKVREQLMLCQLRVLSLQLPSPPRTYSSIEHLADPGLAYPREVGGRELLGMRAANAPSVTHGHLPQGLISKYAT
jgi:hypothetical protein